jgi:coenzyme F420-0:L-glutamate ligase/coenzyme F420-1:gamma-L-glutamate ligase
MKPLDPLDRDVKIWGVRGIPEIRPGDDLCREIMKCLNMHHAEQLQALKLGAHARSCSEASEVAAIFVVAQKVVSKAEGRIVALKDIAPSAQAMQWARLYERDPRMVEIVLRESRRIVRMERGVLIAETHHGYICANAGVDASNAPPGSAILLPEDPDASARRLRAALEAALQLPAGVIVSDTFGRPWRQGLTNVALGLDGFSPFIDYRGRLDSHGRPLHATLLAVADELAAAAELVMGKLSEVPVAVIEGFRAAQVRSSGRELIRPAEEDLFR